MGRRPEFGESLTSKQEQTPAHEKPRTLAAARAQNMLAGEKVQQDAAGDAAESAHDRPELDPLPALKEIGQGGTDEAADQHAQHQVADVIPGI